VNWRNDDVVVNENGEKSGEGESGQLAAEENAIALPDSLYARVTLEVMQMLDLTEGRTLFNMQKYWQHVCFTFLSFLYFSIFMIEIEGDRFAFSRVVSPSACPPRRRSLRG
jgi:hypothetical protein